MNSSEIISLDEKSTGGKSRVIESEIMSVSEDTMSDHSTGKKD